MLINNWIYVCCVVGFATNKIYAHTMNDISIKLFNAAELWFQLNGMARWFRAIIDVSCLKAMRVNSPELPILTANKLFIQWISLFIMFNIYVVKNTTECRIGFNIQSIAWVSIFDQQIIKYFTCALMYITMFNILTQTKIGMFWIQTIIWLTTYFNSNSINMYKAYRSIEFNWLIRIYSSISNTQYLHSVLWQSINIINKTLNEIFFE